MKLNHLDEENGSKDTKSHKGLLVIKIVAVLIIVIGLILLIYGLIPQERINRSMTLQGGNLDCYKQIDLNKGDILVIDYEIDGPDVAFYLTYEEARCNGNLESIEENEHAGSDHYEISIKETGYYYLNFESNEPSSSGTFDVDLTYKVLDRYSPYHLFLGAAGLFLGITLAILYLVLKKKATVVEVDEYIRL